MHPLIKQLQEELTLLEKEIIEDVLCTLTKREKGVFMLVKVEEITFEYTAELLGLTKLSVQTYLERAE
ncbi:sigma factor-like helix-turn-helix DNA-binding protein [Domibacillus sp. 8LH]|uniref:sigma factor-like helix-turn-helix DNA-binding protein n=1 Tax=Domibacillus sp. 8LH TaxID=3073900 RepID=UPI0031751C5F